MSAPRKIWAYDDGLNSPDSRSWSATVPIGAAYHHDDVVRGLVEALTEARTTILDLKNSRCSEAEGLDEDWVCDIAAALANIAQEG